MRGVTVKTHCLQCQLYRATRVTFSTTSDDFYTKFKQREIFNKGRENTEARLNLGSIDNQDNKYRKDSTSDDGIFPFQKALRERGKEQQRQQLRGPLSPVEDRRGDNRPQARHRERERGRDNQMMRDTESQNYGNRSTTKAPHLSKEFANKNATIALTTNERYDHNYILLKIP